MKIKQIEWSEMFEPNMRCGYDHVIGETPFGRFLLTWKGWKNEWNPCFDETPWDDFALPDGSSVAACQQWAQKEFEKRMLEMVDTDD